VLGDRNRGTATAEHLIEMLVISGDSDRAERVNAVAIAY
jgi:hypothetical protein